MPETIFEAIKADHEKQRTLIGLLVKTSGDSEGRAELFERLKRELEDHAIAEERHFYVPLVDSDMTHEHARHGIAEHKELEDLLEKLAETDPSSSGWLATAKKLEEKLIHHLDEEEHQFFQLAGRVFSEDQKTELASAFHEERHSMATA